MKRNYLLYVILSLSLALISINSEARKVPGFIITQDTDTIYGEVKVTIFNLQTAGVLLDGINLEPLHYEVWFRKYGDKRFKDFQAEDIVGFGFKNRSKGYFFRSFTLKSKNVFKNDNSRSRFLQLCHTGTASLYKNLTRVPNHSPNLYGTLEASYEQTFVSYDYFLFNDTIGLTKIEISDKFSTINDLLYLYDYEKDFLNFIPENAKIKDLKGILIKYEMWIESQKPKEIKV